MNNLIQVANSLFAIAQNGLYFSKDEFDIERYKQIQKIAAMMIENNSTLDSHTILDLFSCEKGYATPKVDVRGAVFKDNKILLVKESSDQLWSLPGGWVDINESPQEAVCKEILEESGFETKAIKLLAVYDKNKHPHPTQLPHTYKLFFICQLIGGEKRNSIETTEVDFFAHNQIPSLSPHRVTPFQIARAFEHMSHMDLPTDFD